MISMKNVAIFTFVLLLALGAVYSNKLFAPAPYKETQFMMDTVIEVTAYGQNAPAAVTQVMAEFKRIQDLTNQFDENSEVARLNRLAGQESVVVDKALIEMLQRANANSVKLAGALDVTVGAARPQCRAPV